MTVQEAVAIESLKWLKRTASQMAGMGGEKAFEDFEMSIEALQKQIPKKVIKAFDDEVQAHWCSCPNCTKGLNWERNWRSIKFCPECGQKLDWSKEE